MNSTQVPLTEQQRAALEARDVSVSLAAGAGCGKTFVLTERFISQLDPAGAESAAELDQLIAITFTDAAAREMRDRIRKRCYERLQNANSPREALLWQRLMRSMDAARISTIHAFCTALLRAHAMQAGVDPAFEVLDAPAAELLRLEVIDDRLRTLLVERNDDVLDVAAERGLERLRSDLASFVGPRNAKMVAKWKDASPDQLVAHWIEEFESRAPELAAQELLASGEIRELRRWADPELVITDRVRGHMAQLAVELTEKHIVSRPIGQVLESLDALARVKGVCTAKDWDNAEHYTLFQKAATKLRDRLKKTTMALPDDLDAARDAARIGLALVRLAADVSQALEAAKAHRGQLEFDDLLVRAHRLLTDPTNAALQRRVSERTVLLMVDEFQDTNQLQVDIIKAFCGEGWQRRGLFAVGDFKQSIYRFTGAKPRVSTDLRDALPESGRLSLTTNFRSQPAVLDFVNGVFHGAFPDYEPLVAERAQLTPTPAVEFLWTPGPKAIDGEPSATEGQPTAAATSGRPRKGAKGDARAEEARWIARRIKQVIDSGEPVVVDKAVKPPTLRGLLPGDVAILLRALSDAQLYEEALRSEGLDYYLAGGHAFYSQQEIYDVLNLLRAISSTIDDIALAGALRSPLFALTDETLYWLVQAHGSLNAAIASDEIPAELNADDAAMVRRAAATFAQLRVEKDRLLVADLLNHALELTGYDATLLAEFLGPRKAANIEKLVEQARAVDRSSPGDLPAFITQLSEFVTHAPKEALAATQTEGGNVVRIMTIHHAKGLEFPLVVLPDLERPRHFAMLGPVLDEQLGPLVTLSDRSGCLGYDLYRRLEGAEDLEERKRLFYVACTRAEDHLILSSSINDVDEPSSDLLQLVDQTMSLADGELRLPLPATWNAPKVRVITKRPESVGDAGKQEFGADLHRLVVKTRELSAGTPRPLPFEALERAPDYAARRRFSFSQLTGALKSVEQSDSDGTAEGSGDDDAYEIDLAVLAEEPAHESAGGREFGTLVHAVLQRVDFQRPKNVARLCEFLAPQFVAHEPAKASQEAARVVERFLQTPLAAELSAATAVRREVEFLLQWPPGDGRPDGPYLHGFLDCLFQDSAGRWRLIDYKTNRANAREVTQVAALYDLQMLAYRLACEQALGEPLAECVLVLLHPGLTHTYVPDAAVDSRGVEQISRAIVAMTSGEATRVDM